MPIRKMKTTTKQQRIETERNRHNAALLALALSINPANKFSGLQLWRKLRRVETKAARLALELCNWRQSDDASEAEFEKLENQVAAIFGGNLPPKFYINRDPRGYALKLDSGDGTAAATPFELHQDWGRNQILAPEIN